MGLISLHKQELEVSHLGNNLLKTLRPPDLALVLPAMEEVHLTPRQILYEPGDCVSYVYFPCGPTLLSFIVPLGSGKDVEVALIGREGAVGGIVSQGRLPAYARTIVQYGGTALRLACLELEKAKVQSPMLRQFFARYADCLMAQIFQCVACNATHSIEQRTAKWILAAIDRTNDREMPLTQEQLAGMLGVGRSYVARVLKEFRARQLIGAKHRHLLVLNEDGLASASCNCNVLVRQHFDEVLKGVYPSSDDSSTEKTDSNIASITVT